MVVKRSKIIDIEVAKLVGQLSFGAVIVWLLMHGVQVTIPTFLNMISERDKVFREELERRDEKFAMELDRQRAAHDRSTERLVAAIEALRSTIENTRERSSR